MTNARVSSLPFTVAELATRIGHSVDWFYRQGNLESLYAERMPRPIAGHGHRRWERVGMERWLTRNDPAATPAAANDALPLPDPLSKEDWRKRLAAIYT